MTSSDEKQRDEIKRICGRLKAYTSALRYYSSKLSEYEAKHEAMYVAREIEIQTDNLIERIQSIYKKHGKT